MTWFKDLKRGKSTTIKAIGFGCMVCFSFFYSLSAVYINYLDLKVSLLTLILLLCIQLKLAWTGRDISWIMNIDLLDMGRIMCIPFVICKQVERHFATGLCMFSRSHISLSLLARCELLWPAIGQGTRNNIITFGTLIGRSVFPTNNSIFDFLNKYNRWDNIKNKKLNQIKCIKLSNWVWPVGLTYMLL